MKNQGRFSKQYRGDKCLNCDIPLDIIDKFCHNCGQANTHKKLSLKDFFREYFTSIFSYDSRLRHTIAALIFKPGLISKEYIEGKRAKYANPFRFYLSVSIIFFIINGLFIDFENAIQLKDKNNEFYTDTKLVNEINKETGLTTDSLLLANKKSTTADLPNYYKESELDSMSNFKSFSNRLTTYQQYYRKTNEPSSEKALDSLHHNKNWFNNYLYKRTVKGHKLIKNPTELIKLLFNKLPLIIFFFLPFFTLAIWFAYIRKPFTYMEHLIFTFHTQTMFFFLIGVAYLIDKVANIEIVTKAATIVFLIYLYMAMRKFYQQNKTTTIFKLIFINFLFIILASIGSLVALLGAFAFF